MKKFCLTLYKLEAMRKVIGMIAVFILLSVIAKTQPKDFNNEVLAEVGLEKITYGELQKAYQKNSNRKNVELCKLPKDSLYNFLNIYINYRLKVQDAEKKGYQNKPEIIEEIKQSRKALVESYYYDDVLYKPFLKMMIDKRKIEKKIAIIMQGYNDMAVTDSATALATINQAMAEVKNGVDFADVAKTYSMDKNTSTNGGLIDRWITAGSVARQLEDPIFKTEKGQVYPEVLVVKQSFFIMKVIDEAPRKFVKASHILIQNNPEKNIDSIANVVLAKLKKGESFEKLAKMYSDDNSTKENGGTFPEYYSRSTGYEKSQKQVVSEFENAMFALKKGEISGKVTTQYGIHIIRCDDIRDINPATENEELRTVYRRSKLFTDKQNLLDSLAEAYGYKLNENVLVEILKNVDSTKTNLQSEWAKDLKPELLNSTLFEMNKKKYTVSEFVKILNENADFKGYSLNLDGFLRAIQNFTRPIAFDEETKNYESKNSEFNAMMKEFRDGILLFKVEGDEVWNKLKFDSTKARDFYSKGKEKYKSDLSYDLSEILVFNDSTASDISKKLKSGMNFDTLAKNSTQRGGMREKAGHLGLMSTVKDEQARLALPLAPKKGQILQPIKLEKGIAILRVNEIYPARQKTFEEAIPDFATIFQEMRQKEITENWLNSVKKEIKIVINKKTIDAITK
jgi:peptidyl-prolyl cis-trans isomerase SurA